MTEPVLFKCHNICHETHFPTNCMFNLDFYFKDTFFHNKLIPSILGTFSKTLKIQCYIPMFWRHMMAIGWYTFCMISTTDLLMQLDMLTCTQLYWSPSRAIKAHLKVKDENCTWIVLFSSFGIEEPTISYSDFGTIIIVNVSRSSQDVTLLRVECSHSNVDKLILMLPNVKFIECPLSFVRIFTVHHLQ